MTSEERIAAVNALVYRNMQEELTDDAALELIAQVLVKDISKTKTLALDPGARVEESDGCFIVPFSEALDMDCTDIWASEDEAWNKTLDILRSIEYFI